VTRLRHSGLRRCNADSIDTTPGMGSSVTDTLDMRPARRSAKGIHEQLPLFEPPACGFLQREMRQPPAPRHLALAFALIMLPWMLIGLMIWRIV
jgi:hypothetical protein